MKKLLASLLVSFVMVISQSTVARIVDSVMPHGKVTTYYDNGSKKADKHYKGGIPVGDWESWHTNGRSYTSMSFLGDTGQIEKVEMLYPDGALHYSGVVAKADIGKTDSEYDFNNYPTYFKFGKKCGVVVLHKEPTNTDEIYQFNIFSYYKDGTCEKAEKGNMMRVIARSYFSIKDVTTGGRYNFPWGERPEFIKEKSEK